MAGEDVQIKLTSTADTKGIDQTKQKVRELGNEAKNTGSKIDEVGKSSGAAAGAISAVGGAVSVVDPKAGALMMTIGHLTTGVKGLGMALKALLLNPVALVIGAIVGAFALYQSACEKAREKTKKLYEEITKGINNRIAKENREIAESFATMAHRIADASDRLEHFNELQDLRKGNNRDLYDAQISQKRSAELANAGSQEERDALTKRYQREDIDTNLARTRNDIRTEANRAYGGDVQADFARRRQQITAELERRRSDNGTFQQAKRNVRNAEVMANNKSLSAEDRKSYRESIPQLQAAVDDEYARIKNLGRQLADLNREEEQAKEKHNAILGKLNVATEQAAAKKAELDSQETIARNKQREDIEKKIADIEKDREYGSDNHEVKMAGNYTTNGGFASAAAKLAAGVSVTYTAENKAQAARDKQIKLLTEQLEKLDKIARGTEDGGATFG